MQCRNFALCFGVTRNSAKDQTDNALAVLGRFDHSPLNLLAGAVSRFEFFGQSPNRYVRRDKLQHVGRYLVVVDDQVCPPEGFQRSKGQAFRGTRPDRDKIDFPWQCEMARHG